MAWEGLQKVCSPGGRQEGVGVAAQWGPPILARWAGKDEVMMPHVHSGARLGSRTELPHNRAGHGRPA